MSREQGVVEIFVMTIPNIGCSPRLYVGLPTVTFTASDWSGHGAGAAAAVEFTVPAGAGAPEGTAPDDVAELVAVAAPLVADVAEDAALEVDLPPCSSMITSQITRASTTTITPMASSRRRQ
jgi:hypothetical protein